MKKFFVICLVFVGFLGLTMEVSASSCPYTCDTTGSYHETCQKISCNKTETANGTTVWLLSATCDIPSGGYPRDSVIDVIGCHQNSGCYDIVNSNGFLSCKK